MNEKKCRGLTRNRSGGICELRIPGVCLGRATNYQHRKNKSQCSKVERWLPSNGLDACGSGTTGCHGYIHANQAEAVEKGWTVRSWDDPHTRPVHLWHGVVVLDDLGCFTPALELGGVT